MPNAGLAEPSDIPRGSQLYQLPEVSRSVTQKVRAEHIWSEMLSHEGIAVFVSTVVERIVASCMLITAPNLLRGGRLGCTGFWKMLSHPEFRGQGHGRAVVHAALAAAWAKDCCRVLLESGRKEPRVHRFDKRSGFEPGLRIGYVCAAQTHNSAIIRTSSSWTRQSPASQSGRPMIATR
jgi:GNAT superfamily N-acetyltransferase